MLLCGRCSGSKWKCGKTAAGPGVGAAGLGFRGARLCPSSLVHCQETLLKKSSKDWEHMFIL